MQDLFSLQGKVALVTGAAQGIGREIALGFAQYGADIVAVDLNDERLQKLKAEVEAEKRRCLVLKVDLVQTGTTSTGWSKTRSRRWEGSTSWPTSPG